MRVETGHNRYIVQNTYWFTSSGDVVIVSIHILKSWLLAVNLLASLMSHWKTHLLDESEGGLFGKLTECRLNLSRGHRIRDCVWSRSLQRDSFSPDLPVVSEYKFEQCFLYP